MTVPFNAELIELAQLGATWVDRCQHWAWDKYNPGEEVPETNWPPGKTGEDMMWEYWLLLWHKSKAYHGENWTEPTTLEARVQRSLDLSAADPYCRFAYPVTHWVTANIRGTDTRIPVTDIASWVKFAANVYTVTLNDARVGRVSDAAFEQKVA